jgi:ADP-heptose:LPS heptosyltransferase
LRQTQSPGDILTLTRPLADLKESYPNWQIDVRTPCPEIFENNPHLTPLKEEEAEIFTIGYDEINDCHWRQQHWTDAYRHDLEKQLGVKIKKTGIYPELWISDLEKSWYNQVHCTFEWDGAYWLINAGHKQDNELKLYNCWQEVVDILNQYWQGKVKIVQIGDNNHIHPPLKGVLNLVGLTDTRQLIRLAYNAAGTIGPLSFQSVISAALKQPAVVVMGGKEDVRWHLYPHMKYIYSNGSLDCCQIGGCWLGGEKGKCKNLINGVPKCFDIIKPRTIADAVISYYEGGRLHG